MSTKPDSAVEVHYSGPLVTFLSGAIGFEEQPRPGVGAHWAIMAVPIAFWVIGTALIAVIIPWLLLGP